MSPPPSKPWGLVAGFAAVLATVGAVYFLMDGRVVPLEESQKVTEQALEDAEQGRTRLAEKQAEELERALEEERKLRTDIDRQREDVDRHTDRLRDHTRATGRLEDRIFEAEKAGTAQARQLSGLRDQLRARREAEVAIRNDLRDAEQGLRDLDTKLLTKTKANADLIETNKVQHDADMRLLREAIDQKQRIVDDLAKRLRGVSGAKQRRLESQLEEAQDDLAELNQRLTDGLKTTVRLVQLKDRAQKTRLQRLKEEVAAGTGVLLQAGMTKTSNQLVLLWVSTADGSCWYQRARTTSGSRRKYDWVELPEGGYPTEVGTPGRYVVELSYDTTGLKAYDAVRLDTATGMAWHCDLRGGPSTWKWKKIINGYRRAAEQKHTWRLKVVRGSAAHRSPSDDRDFILVTDTTTGRGRVYTDRFSARKLLVPVTKP